MIKQVYDVKGIDMGNGLVRYKAEIDFDGRELARSYIERYLLPNYILGRSCRFFSLHI